MVTGDDKRNGVSGTSDEEVNGNVNDGPSCPYKYLCNYLYTNKKTT